ncbi:sulfurtransferase [Leucobacter iarius]|uniref:Sulfurtransferase n=1 Tax=Leucobacter iarius TaxID=333963 RepID=A0ABP4XHG6_9MICO
MTAPILISAEELRTWLDSDEPPRVLDVRYRLGFSDGHEQYLAGHISGAVFADLEGEFARHGAPSDGRHPLPGDAALEVAARGWGIRDGQTVVVYDDARSLPASRAWWALRRAGIGDVRLLDGGLAAWIAAGGAVDPGEVVPEPGDVVLARPGAAGVLTTGQVAEWDGILLDARAPERFRGESEPIDPIAGHIPGARNLPISEVLTEDGRFRSPERIAAAFASAGVGSGAGAGAGVDAGAGETRIAAYCGSGVTAAQLALAGALIGREVVVFPGSWSAWSNTPGLPVATGE